MGFFDKVKDVLTTSDKERAQKAREDAAKAQSQAQERADDAARRAEEAARKAGDPADSTTPEEAATAREEAVEAQREAAEKQAEADKETAAARPGYRTVTVQKGDTLSGIAARHDVDWREMAALNKLDNPDLIYPGQVFKVPNS